MRAVFCGSGSFAVPSLRALVEGGHELTAVVTQPARPAGRGGKPRATPVAHAAQAAQLVVRELADVNEPESVAWIAALRPDVICVADFGQMIRKPARDSARLDAINLHGSLLPELRGAAPINWAIIRGCERTGVTTFSLVDEMDAGAVYLQAAADIRPDETAEELEIRLADIGAQLLCRTIDTLADGAARPRPQDHSLATRAPMLKKTDGLIDWSADAEAVRNRIHGTWPWPGAKAMFRSSDGSGVQIVIARAAAEPHAPAGPPGQVDRDLCVATGRGRIRILQLRPAGSKLMGWPDFVNGYRVAEGDALVPPEAQQ